MLVLFETAAGYALFEVLNEGKLENPEELWKEFDTPQNANKAIKLKSFKKFENMASAVSSISDISEGKLSDDLSNFLKETINETSIKTEKLIVADPKLGASINKKLGIQVLSEKIVMDLYRGIRENLDSLITGMNSEDISSMALGLSHSLSRHKLKFSPDKVDTMIIQAIGLLDDLDKELNTYAMRVKEWYGWHFPEMSKIVVDNLAYAKVVKAMGFRSNAQECDLSDILPEDLEKEVKEAAEISMGTEISDEDINNIIMGCDQVISLTSYRTELYDYLKSRMLAIAPNLTTIVGELVGARLISHAGSLINLAKHPSSTVQILGAEKALFRALKTKNATPKYGLIYHASLVGQASAKNKGKVARLVASKSSLATRFDAIADEKDVMAELGNNCRKMIETRLRFLEKGSVPVTTTDKRKKQQKFELISTKPSYSSYADIANEPVEAGPSGTKAEESDDSDESDDSQMDIETEDTTNVPLSKSEGKKPVKQREIKEQPMQIDEPAASDIKKEKKKKEKKKKDSKKQETVEKPDVPEESEVKKEKKKKDSKKQEPVEKPDVPEESEVKKEKKKKDSKKQESVEKLDVPEESEVKKEKKKKKPKTETEEHEKKKLKTETEEHEKKKRKEEKVSSSSKEKVETPHEGETSKESKKAAKKKKAAEEQTTSTEKLKTPEEPKKSEKKKKKIEGEQSVEAGPSTEMLETPEEPKKSEKKKKKAVEKPEISEEPKKSEISEEPKKSEKKKEKSSKKRKSSETEEIIAEQSVEPVEPAKPEKSKKLKVSKDKSVKVEEEPKKSKGKQKEEEPVKAESSKVEQKSKEKKEKKKKKEKEK